MPHLFQNIVEILISKRKSHYSRFETIELRIGNQDSRGAQANQPLSANLLVATLEHGDDTPTHLFKLARPVNGKLMTPQMMKRQYLEVDEVNVNVAI